jgi:16S rRNA processing protein RimM
MTAEGTPAGKRPVRRRLPAPKAPREGYVAVGVVQRPWGVHGELKVESLTDNPDRFRQGARVFIRGADYRVDSGRSHKGALLLQLREVRGSAAAEALRGQLIEVPEGDLPDLPDDTYYRHQLVGMEVRSTDGELLGRIADLLDTGANDVFVVRGDGGELLIPAVDDVVRDVDVAAGRMTIEMVEGLAEPPKKARPRPRRGVGRAGG